MQEFRRGGVDVKERPRSKERQVLHLEDLNTLVGTRKVFADTCSLMHHKAERFFREVLAPVMEEAGGKLIIPIRVVQELRKFQRKGGIRGERALKGEGILTFYQQKGMLSIHGQKGDPFADNVFLAVFTRFMTVHGLCLITQDRKLGQDILALRDTGSVERKKSIDVFRISGDGRKLLPHDRFSSKKETVPYAERFAIGTCPISYEEKSSFGGELPGAGDVVFSEKLGPLKLVSQLGEGGEGTTWETPNGLVCKIYRRSRLIPALRRKLQLMLFHPMDNSGICWPLDIVTDKNKNFVGYVMPRAQGRPMQSMMFSKPVLLRSFPDWSRKNLVRLATSVLEKFVYLHGRNVLIGDINPQNILVKSDSEVYLVDTDSFQVQDYPCPVGTVNFTAPEIQNRDFKTFLRTSENEAFAVAVLVFMILLPGKPPYSQQGGSEPGANIRSGNFPYAVGEKHGRNVPRGPWRFIFSHLPRYMKDAFNDVFNNGKRISVRQWLNLLERYRNDLESGFVSDELFPRGIKIIDPVEVRCSRCGKTFVASGTWVNDLRSRKKDIFCSDCREQVLCKCDVCGKDFSMPLFQADSLEKARRSLICPECRTPVVETCAICGRDFKTAKFMAQKIRSEGKNLICTKCRSELPSRKSAESVIVDEGFLARFFRGCLR